MRIEGEWENQNGSVLTIDECVGSRIAGTFRSEKGRAAKDKQYPVTGLVNDEIASFCVDFTDADANLHAITSFSGRLAKNADGIDVIHTVWVLARQFEDSEQTKPTHPWNTFLVNSDVFTRID